MTSESRAWERPDGTLVVRDPHGRYGADVTWLAADDPAPEGAVPLVAAPEVDGDDPRPPTTSEVRAWVLHNFGGEQSSAEHTIGLSEEVGELCRAVLKRQQGIRGTAEEWTAEVRKELGDVVIKAHDIAAHEGFDLDELVAERWAVVSRRDWKADPIGHGVNGQEMDAAAPVAGDRRLADLYAQAQAWVSENVASRKTHPSSPTHSARRVALEEAANTVLNVVEGRLTGLAEHYARQGEPETAEEDDPRLTLPVVVEFLGSANDRWHRWALRPGETAAAEVVRTLLPRVHAVRVHRGECGGSEPGSERSAVAPDTQSAAPTRDEHLAIVSALQKVGTIRVGDSTVARRAALHDEADRMAETALQALGVLRGGGADEGGEDDHWCEKADGLLAHLASIEDDLRSHGHRVGARSQTGNTVRAALEAARNTRDRLCIAAGVSPDSEDVVGAIEAAIRAGREPERMLGRDAEKLPRGSWVTHHADFDEGRAFPRMKTATEGWQPENVTNGLVGHQDYVVLHRAPAPAPTPLTVGDVVTGSRAVSAPVGTKLGAKSAAVAAVHTVNGWSVTGMGREQDHEEYVRLNEWVVLALGDGSET